jgi:serine/threonine protein kinase
LADSLLADRYRISRILGSGGMAEVYLARDCRLDRDVALKLLPHRYACDRESVERFRREAGAAARLNHPNVVQVYDWGEAGGTYYISMEYVPGRSLKEIIREEGPLSPERIVSVATQILDALAVVHAAGLVHRDIKPQNILIDDRGRAKVADLGIARAADSAGMTAKGSMVGTAHYLSPEQAGGETAVPASDLYSVGVVMYEMATGRPPFTGDNPVAIAMQHVGEPPVPPSQLRPGLPAELEGVILRALSKSPAGRWGSADEFSAALRSPASQTPMLERTQIRPGPGAGVVPTERPVGRWLSPQLRRHALIWSLVTVLCLVLAGGAYGAVALFRADTVVVPSLVGRTIAEAEAEAAIAGLKVEQGGPSENSSEHAQGTIVRQQPASGTSDPKGKVVYVWLSAGPASVLVPDVKGLTQQRAVDTLRSSKLEVVVVKQETADETPGEVYDQYPRAGIEVKAGDTVEIMVAVAPPTTTTTSTTTTTTTIRIPTTTTVRIPTRTTRIPTTTTEPRSSWWPWDWWGSDD